MYKWGKLSLSRKANVNPILLETADLAMKILYEKNHTDIKIPWRGGLRTAEEQNEIFKNGNSNCDGFNKKSYHQSGNALDIIPIDGYTNEKGFRQIARAMFLAWQKIDTTKNGFLEWGGLWSNFVDKPHWQIVQK